MGKRKRGHRQPGNSGANDARWNSNDIRGVLHNPIYVGIGTYPALIDEATWIKAQESAIKGDGFATVLGQIRRLTEESLGGVPDWMAASDWIATATAQHQRVGTMVFFSSFLKALRDSYE